MQQKIFGYLIKDIFGNITKDIIEQLTKDTISFHYKVDKPVSASFTQ